MNPPPLCSKHMKSSENDRLKEHYGTTVEIPVCRIGATIGVHAGPTSIGYGLIRHAQLPGGE